MLDFLLQFVSNFLSITEQVEVKKIRKSEAISALRDALRHTRTHIDLTRIVDVEENYDDQASLLLQEKWATAAKLIRPFDKQFAFNLELKSDYWINPSGFKNDIQSGKIRYDYRFHLNHVIKNINTLEQILFS